MPTYDYKCEKCSNIFEEYRTVDERNETLGSRCPNCDEIGGVQKIVGGFPGIGVDFTLTPDKKTDGKFSEIMKRVKESVPERMRGKLDNATNMRGHRWKQ